MLEDQKKVHGNVNKNGDNYMGNSINPLFEKELNNIFIRLQEIIEVEINGIYNDYILQCWMPRYKQFEHRNVDLSKESSRYNAISIQIKHQDTLQAEVYSSQSNLNNSKNGGGGGGGSSDTKSSISGNENNDGVYNDQNHLIHSIRPIVGSSATG